MKTAEELTAVKEKVEAVNKKLRELSDEELAEVTGGLARPRCGASKITVERNDVSSVAYVCDVCNGITNVCSYRQTADCKYYRQE